MTTTVALVLETNNLRGGGADVARTVVSLGRLLVQLRDQTRPLDTLAELVVTHDGLPAAARERLAAAAGVAIHWIELPTDADYYAAKNLGFDATTADVVAFADADCWPEPEWLAALTAPFADPTVQVVAGRTTYRKDLLGAAASTIDFMYWPSPLGAGCTRNFYANNVAFRRDVFAAHRYAEEDMYRGHCQVMGLRLQAAGVPVRFVPVARTIHRFPDRAAELLRLRLLRGQDAVELTPHLMKTYAPAAARLGNLGPVVPLAVLATRFAYSVRALGRQDMPETRGLAWLACVGAIAGLSLADSLGAAARGLGLTRAAPAPVTLSYHEDRDHLAAA